MKLNRAKSTFRGISVIFVVTLISVFLDHFGFFRAYEHAALDTLFAFSDSIESQDIVIVEIDDNSYETIFNSTSLLTLCNQLEPDNKYGIVDLDTSSTQYNGNKCNLKVCLDKPNLTIMMDLPTPRKMKDTVREVVNRGRSFF